MGNRGTVKYRVNYYRFDVNYYNYYGECEDSETARSEFGAYRIAERMEAAHSGGEIVIEAYYMDCFEEEIDRLKVSWKPHYVSAKEKLLKQEGNTTAKVQVYFTNKTQYPFEVYLIYDNQMHDIKTVIDKWANGEIKKVYVPSDKFSVAFRIYGSVYLYKEEYSTNRFAIDIVFNGTADKYYKCTVPNGTPLNSSDLKEAARMHSLMIHPNQEKTLNSRNGEKNSSTQSKKTGKEIRILLFIMLISVSVLLIYLSLL